MTGWLPPARTPGACESVPWPRGGANDQKLAVTVAFTPTAAESALSTYVFEGLPQVFTFLVLFLKKGRLFRG